MKKAVYGYTAGAWTLSEERLFVYDGWNLVEEIDRRGGNETSRYFVWGLDMSQSMQGAGGIGGLVAEVDAAGGLSGSSLTYYFCYDGNGNVGQVINAADGSIAAAYEYDPYGKVLKADGGYAGENPFRFSTKYWDDETGLGYWGYRYYSSELGRWLSKDPLGEMGSLNFYSFIDNNSTNSYDYLGLYNSLWPFAHPCDKCTDISRDSNFWYNSWKKEVQQAEKIKNIVEGLAKLAAEGQQRFDYINSGYMDAKRRGDDLGVEYWLEEFQNTKKGIQEILANIPNYKELYRLSMENAYEYQKQYEETLQKYHKCMNGCCAKGWYCYKGTRVIGGVLDTASIILTMSGIGGSLASGTFLASTANNTITFLFCEKSDSAKAVISQAVNIVAYKFSSMKNILSGAGEISAEYTSLSINLFPIFDE